MDTKTTNIAIEISRGAVLGVWYFFAARQIMKKAEIQKIFLC